ncbi:MAG: GNAT family N-acetyltransferase [Rhodobacteraceae bacterium]|nr:MAG: GNAT family N-acetyltransferase [Paracoccaceae bacterium]
MGLQMRRAQRGADDAAVWEILRPAVESGETFCADPAGGQAGGLAYFWPETSQVWIAEEGGVPLGCCYLRPNQTGGGAHVCNAGYCTAPAALGRGVARAMLAFSLDEARRQGYRAMQYNFVVETNTRAIATWQRAGFAIVGRLPAAFRHPRAGYVDALVMYKSLV